MIRYFILAGYFLLALLIQGFSQNRINTAFEAGETLTYRIYYSSAIIDATAGQATLVVNQSINHGTGDTVYHVTGNGYSKGLFDLFFTVRDTYESYFDKNTLLPDTFIRDTHEGSYSRYDFVTFNRKNLTAKTSRKTIAIPPKTFDIISAFYYMRTLTVADFNADSIYLINFYLDDSVYHSAIKYMGRDTLMVNNKKTPAIKLAPMMATGEVFADKYPMFVWVTDDKKHIPVFAKSKIIVGSVNVELIKSKNIFTGF